ncbi:uncharacterized protein [Primulina eburnea]|uniref:uncharacterized protein n=1 Tax=Primulina eburnea TaxID=1245227 RepID=UPI003C6C93BA
MVEKSRNEWTREDKKKANLDNVAKDILYKTLDKNTFSKIKTCSTAKEIREKLIQICEGNEQTKENKLFVAIQKFGNLKMKAGETLNEFDERFSSLVNELAALDYEFELVVRSGEEPSTNIPTKALAASAATTSTAAVVVIPQAVPATFIESTSENTAEKIINDATSLFVKKFSRFMKKNHRAYQNPYRNFKKDSPPSDMACFNCGKIGHFIADCPKPKKDDQKKKDESDVEEIKCLMADVEPNSTSEKVFDFDSDEFTRIDLIKALHDMVGEYSRLSQSFEEIKIENLNLKNQVSKFTCLQENSCNDLKVEMSKLKTENERVKADYQTMRSENQKLSILEQVEKAKVSSSTWYMDTGCSRHMTGQKNLLSEIMSCTGPKIAFGDNSKGSERSLALIIWVGLMKRLNDFVCEFAESYSLTTAFFRNRDYIIYFEAIFFTGEEMVGAYILNAYQVNFASVLTIKD